MPGQWEAEFRSKSRGTPALKAGGPKCSRTYTARRMSSSDVSHVSAVIVHYRTVDDTVEAARALALTAPEVEVVVVDNASDDSIARRLSAEAPAARLLVETENRGYGAACNQGARETSRPFLLLLNSDAFVQPAAVESLVAALDSDPSAAAVGPRLANPDGTLQASILRLPTLWRIFCERSGPA